MSKHALDIERTVIGGILVDNNQIHGLALVPEDFVSRIHQAIFNAQMTLAQRGVPIDPLTVCSEIRHSKMLNGEMASVRTILCDSMDGIPKASNLPHWAELVRTNSSRRQRRKIALLIADAVENEDSEATIEELISELTTAAPMRAIQAEPMKLVEVFGDSDEPIPWIVKGWLASGESLLIGGQGGIGKSTLILDLALALASGNTDFLGIPIDAPQSVLYIDEENGAPLIRRRLQRNLRGRGHSADSATKLPISMYCKPGINLDTTDGLAEFRRIVEDSKPDWVFLDSLVRFHSRDENDNSAMARFFQERIEPTRRKYGFGLVILHHVAKPSSMQQRGRLHDMRGASDLVNQADCVWAYCRDGNDRKLSICKSRWSTDGDELLVCLNETNDTAQLTADTPNSSVETLIGTQLVMAAERGMLRQELIDVYTEESGKKPDTAEKAVGRALTKMRGRGTVRDDQDGHAKRFWLTDMRGRPE